MCCASVLESCLLRAMLQGCTNASNYYCFWQRAMPSSFFVLLRFFLRVDGVLIRMNDTRLYHEVRKPKYVYIYIYLYAIEDLLFYFSISM